MVEDTAYPQNEHMVRLDQDPGQGKAFQDTFVAGKHTLEAGGTSPLGEDAGVVDPGGAAKLLEEALEAGPVLEVAEFVVGEVRLLQKG